MSIRASGPSSSDLIHHLQFYQTPTQITQPKHLNRKAHTSTTKPSHRLLPDPPPAHHPRPPASVTQTPPRSHNAAQGKKPKPSNGCPPQAKRNLRALARNAIAARTRLAGARQLSKARLPARRATLDWERVRAGRGHLATRAAAVRWLLSSAGIRRVLCCAAGWGKDFMCA